MKKITSSLLCGIFCLSLTAQVDTVLYEDFQVDVLNPMINAPTGTDTDWVNYDEDGLDTNNGTEVSKRWYYGAAITNAVDTTTGITNYVALSLSFLQDAMPGNRNWLVLPPVMIEDDTYMLHWESAPNQLPRYMDGYHVLLSTNGNLVDDFSEVLFEAASMESITGDGQSTDFSNFTFTPGYKHADCATITEYISPGTNVYFGVLEPHSIDLSAYEGKEVYIAFLHNSDDDDRITLDDILITKAADPSSTRDVASHFRIECYPNPVTELMNISYTALESSTCQLKIYSQDGTLVKAERIARSVIGNNVHTHSLAELPKGSYQVELIIGKSKYSQQILKL